MANYPLPAFHFQVEWGGKNLGFSEVSGLNVQTQIIEYRDGLSPDFSMLKLSGLKKYSNITLKRGIAPADNDFFEWINATKMSTADRRDLIISLLNENHPPVMTWKVKQAWPVKVDGPSLKSSGNEVA